METGKLYRLISLLAFAAMHVPAESRIGKSPLSDGLYSLKSEMGARAMEEGMEKRTSSEFLELVQALTVELARSAKMVAFSAYTPVNASPTTGSTIVFSNTQINEGNAYSTSTGVFTAPDAGLYEFNAHICNGGNKNIVYAINRNDYETLALSTQSDDTDSCGSVNALARLDAGDKVFLKCVSCEQGVQLSENRHRRNTFSGVLLQLS